MKSKDTLGAVLKRARGEAGMTQRELAEQLGIKASHIAYLESGQRRPSMVLLQKLSRALDLNAYTLFMLAFPQAREMLGGLDSNRAPKKSDSWRDFIAKKPTLRRYQMTPAEMRLLRAIHRTHPVSTPKDFVFLLLAMRQAWGA
jgi:transcriptional regulator with XRE-family HTH domain